MEPLWIVAALMALVILGLAVKIYLMKKSAAEIADAFALRLREDTNTLIDISSRDPNMLRLAADINGRLRLLRAERLRLERGGAELSGAITAVSHDLRTPLTAIMGYLELLDREEKSEAVSRGLARIRERTEALRTLTDELFSYSLAASVRELKSGPVDVGRCLEESLLSFYGAVSRRGLDTEVELPEAPVMRELDPEALGRVFSNVISNAVKYSDGDLKVEMTPDCLITFSNSAKELNAVTVGRLFDRFYTVAANRGSTGLGLSIAKLLTEKMGGAISADFRDGRLYIVIRF